MSERSEGLHCPNCGSDLIEAADPNASWDKRVNRCMCCDALGVGHKHSDACKLLTRARKKHDAPLFGLIKRGPRHTWRTIYESEGHMQCHWYEWQCIVCGVKRDAGYYTQGVI